MKYLTALKDVFEPQANAAHAAPMKAYMKDRFKFLGIKTPVRRELTRDFIRASGLPNMDILPDLCRALWAEPCREYQYFGLDLLRRLQRKLTPDHLPLLEELVLTQSWWDTVDMLAGRNVGDLLLRYPAVRDDTLAPWRQSDNLWLRRTAILFQLHYKSDTDEKLLSAVIRENLGSREFFINKAIGWILREYSKTAPQWVIHFVETTDLAPLSAREALKWLQKH